MSPETVPGRPGCVVTLIIGHKKDSGNKGHKQIDPGQSNNFQQGRGLERAETNSVKVLWLEVPEPNSNSGSFEQRGIIWEDNYKHIYGKISLWFFLWFLVLHLETCLAL